MVFNTWSSCLSIPIWYPEPSCPWTNMVNGPMLKDLQDAQKQFDQVLQEEALKKENLSAMSEEQPEEDPDNETHEATVSLNALAGKSGPHQRGILSIKLYSSQAALPSISIHIGIHMPQILIHWSNTDPTEATWEDFAFIKDKYPSFDPWGQGRFARRGNVMNIIAEIMDEKAREELQTIPESEMESDVAKQSNDFTLQIKSTKGPNQEILKGKESPNIRPTPNTLIDKPSSAAH